MWVFIECLNLEKYLKHDIWLENDNLIDILNYIKIINSFSNGYIAYGIMLTIPAKRTSFKT